MANETEKNKGNTQIPELPTMNFMQKYGKMVLGIAFVFCAFFLPVPLNTICAAIGGVLIFYNVMVK